MAESLYYSWLGSLASIVHPIFVILLTIVILPTLLLSYPVCQWSRRCWVRFIKWKYPNCIVVEESSTRSILDQGRNQGVYTLLVECPTIVTEHLKNHLVHLASSKLLLRMALTTKCFKYAWEKIDDFSVDNHLIIAPTSYKGRPITEYNIQDYVSDVTSKYLPATYSPWQVHVLGHHHRSSRRFLIRVHHQLLRQEKLTLGDFLPLKQSIYSDNEKSLESPFSAPYTEPLALPRLHQKLNEIFSNTWNEFLYNNDPIERPEILKKKIGTYQFIKIFIIVCFSTVKEISRQYHRKEGPKLLSAVLPAYKREARKRNFSWYLVLLSLINIINPIEFSRNTIAWIWYLAIVISLKAPLLLWREIRAISLLQEHHYYPDSLVSVLSIYLPLIFKASLEIISILTIIIRAPFSIFEELSRSRSSQLRTGSQSGRKVVAWSDVIEVELLKRINSVTGAGDAEILLAAAVDSLKEYFKCSGQTIPDEILATAKLTSQRALYVSDHESKGLLCLSLPTRTPLFDDDLVEILQAVQKNIQDARRRQKAIYAIISAESSSGILTSCLPSILLKIVLNHLTRRYSISITHVDGDLPIDGVQSAVFWKPPQGNLILSMTLHRHGNYVRLGVMGDAMIGPQHLAITRAFPTSLERLARTLGVEYVHQDQNHLQVHQRQQRSRSPSPNVSY